MWHQWKWWRRPRAPIQEKLFACSWRTFTFEASDNRWKVTLVRRVLNIYWIVRFCDIYPDDDLFSKNVIKRYSTFGFTVLGLVFSWEVIHYYKCFLWQRMIILFSISTPVVVFWVIPSNMSTFPCLGLFPIWCNFMIWHTLIQVNLSHRMKRCKLLH
jgi:hypothetical protein